LTKTEHLDENRIDERKEKKNPAAD